MTIPFLGLIHNVALLLAIALIFDAVKARPFKFPYWVQQLLVGCSLGILGIFIMLTHWEFAPGIVFDTRSVLLSVSGLFFGLVPTVVGMILTAAFRISQGGVGVWTGVLLIVAMGMLGIAWRNLRSKPLVDISIGELFVFGLISHLVMLGLMLTLPWETNMQVLSSIGLPVFILYPIGTVLLGSVMRNRLQREQAECRIRESEEQYRLLADNISDVLWILNLETHRWEYVSPSVERLLGYSVEEALAQSVENVVAPTSYGKIWTLVQERIAHALRGEELGTTYINEIEQTRKDGSVIWAEVVTRYVRNNAGQLTLLGITRNITERKKAEESLRVSEDNFRRLVEESPIPILVQTEGRFAYVNPACVHFLGARTDEQLLGESVEERFHPDYRQSVRDRLKQLNVERKELSVAEMKVLKFDGTEADVQTFGTPFVMHGKSGSLGFMLDISGKKEADSMAFALALERQHMSMLTSFVKDAAHEFRTPLSVIVAELYLLEKLLDTNKREQKIAEIKQQFFGLTRLIDVLTKYVQIYGETSIHREPLDLNEVISTSIDGVHRHLLSNAPAVDCVLLPELPAIYGDPDCLQTAINEILLNAFRFTPTEGSVSIRSGLHTDGVMVEIQDSGPGIPEDMVPHIFERFFRQDTAHTTPGFGLGLSIAQAIANHHGGRIEVESQVGVGSLFRIVLPITVNVDGIAGDAVGTAAR
jgi:PAS domain S-box-containing protein